MNRSDKMAALWISAAIVFSSLVISLFSYNYNAFAQAGQAADQADQANQTGGKSEEAKTMYKPAYPKAMADSRNSLTIQSDKHLINQVRA